MADREEAKPEVEEDEIQLANAKSPTPLIVGANAASHPDSKRPPEPQISGILHSLISQTSACQYEFAEYFVAWQGVLTVAFSGIPPSLCRLKQDINARLPACIVRENPGSKWPKISLGCLRDDMTLSLDELHKLRQICSEERPPLAATAPVIVDDLSVVLYATCCLEKTITVATTPLKFPVNLSRPSTEETGFVREVLNEFAPENVECYQTFTSKAGNRSAHYRSAMGGATLVHFLKSVPGVLADFRARVDSELPGMYDWFRDDSLHITVRALL